MAQTTATWSDRNSPPSLSGMSVNDTKIISGQFATISLVRAECRKWQGGIYTAKLFNTAMNGYQSVIVTRTA